MISCLKLKFYETILTHMSPSSANYMQLRTAMDRPRPKIPLAAGGVKGGGTIKEMTNPL